MLHLEGKLFKSRRCLLLVRRDYIGSSEFTIYEMRKGCSVWSIKYLVDTDDFISLFPEGWSIRSIVWSILLGEREEESFFVINLSGKVVEYNLISKTLCEIYDVRSNQVADDYHCIFCVSKKQGSRSGPKRRRTYIPREQEDVEQRLIDDYFGDDEFLPKYPEENFRQRYDCTGRLSIGPILKCTSAIRQLAYDTAPDAFDEYLQIAERTSRQCLEKFTKCIHVLYVEKFLRKPTTTDVQKALHGH
ncbi:hypothetical protein Tco_1306042 [Tanacetum coccineum]